MVKLKQFECTIENWFENKPVYYFISTTPSKARYKLWKESRDVLPPFKEALKLIKIRTLKNITPEYFFSSKEQFDSFRNRRNIPLVFQGMNVEVNGKHGIIVGSNSSLNLDVLLDDGNI